MIIPPWEDPRRVLARHGGRAQKRFSQNFLTSSHVVERIAQSVGACDGETVVEIGPGVGSLTGALLRTGASVIALEKDPAMRAILAEEFADAPLDVRDADAKQVNFHELGVPTPLRLCGNLPYAITGPILRAVVDQRDTLARAVIMVQKEVGDRLRAGPGSNYGVMSVFVSACFDVHLVCPVGRGAFHPPPRVDSSVLCLEPRTPRADVSDPVFVAIVKAAFSKRRKTLRNALKALDVQAATFEAASVDPSRRGETLSVEEFDALAKAHREAAP